MGKNLPFFSIIIPTYNRAGLIAKTISSLLNQTFQHFEIIIIDDGSKDNTEEVIREIPDLRVQYYKVENGERGRARNIGTLKAKGDYITFIDSDDLAYPNHLEEAVRLIEMHQDPPCLHLAYEMRDSFGKQLALFLHKDSDLNYQLLNGNLFSCIGVFLRKDIAKEFLFKEDRALAGTEDWLLWLTIASRFTFIGSNTITSCMINHESRSVLNFNKDQMMSRTKLLVHYLYADDCFKSTFGESAINAIEAHMYTYMALHSVLSKNNADGLNLFYKGIKLNLREFFQRRTLAIFKYFLINQIH